MIAAGQETINVRQSVCSPSSTLWSSWVCAPTDGLLTPLVTHFSLNGQVTESITGASCLLSLYRPSCLKFFGNKSFCRPLGSPDLSSSSQLGLYINLFSVGGGRRRGKPCKAHSRPELFFLRQSPLSWQFSLHCIAGTPWYRLHFSGFALPVVSVS